jgi:hypothetical protein
MYSRDPVAKAIGTGNVLLETPFIPVENLATFTNMDESMALGGGGVHVLLHSLYPWK